MESGNDLSSRAVSSQVLSTQRSLTAVFGMGTGGTSPPLSPETVIRTTFRLSVCLSVPSKPHTGTLRRIALALSAFLKIKAFQTFAF